MKVRRAIIAFALRHLDISENFGDHIKEVAAQL